LSKQALHQQRKQKEKKSIQEEEILQAISHIRTLYPVIELKKIYTFLESLPLGRDKFIDLAKEHRLQAKMPENKQSTTFSTKSHITNNDRMASWEKSAPLNLKTNSKTYR
jgi:hypothetical protein